jgi:multisubunit Na+/H+ antiporter MnhG subunit
MGLAAINIKFTADLRGFSTEMQNSIRRIGALGKELQTAGRGLSTFVTLPLVAAGAAAVKFASDYEESVNKVNVAFGPASEGVKEFAKTSLESFGIAEGTALDLAATYGDMATALGLPVENAAAMSKSLVGLAGDLASFKNISIDIANTALTSIFTGETESLKKLGIVMTEANLQAFALSQGINKQVKDMSQAEKVGLRYNYVLSVTKNAQGDFARTGGGAANQMRIFQESLKQIAQQLGAVILPLFTKAITFVNGLIKGFSGLSDETKTTIVVVAGIAAAIGPLLTVMGSLLTFVPNLITKFNALKDAFIGLKAIIVANPYTALAIAIAAIAGGIYLWYSNQKKVVSGQEALNNAIATGNKNAASEVATLDRLYQSSTDVKKGIDERKASYKSLQELYPAYFKNIDFENLKNAQSVGIYKELREAIFAKARATAIEQELQKRASERVEQEIALKEKIARTEAEIQRIKKGANTIVLQEASAGEKSARVTASKTDLLLAQNKLLKIQQKELENFTKQALAQDEILLNSKAEYDTKTAKLTENEIARQKALMEANALQIEENNKLKANTIAYFESLISQAQKEQKEVALTGKEFDTLQTKIDAYQKKIDGIQNSGRVLPKPELPTDEAVFTPSFSLEDLNNQMSYYEQQRDRYSKTSDDFVRYSEKINSIKLQINAIEGVDEVNAQFEGVKTQAETMREALHASLVDGLGNAFSTMSENMVESLGLAQSGLQGFMAGLAKTVLKLLSMYLAQSISASIAGATASGAATGPGAFFTTPGFIAAAVSGVIAAFAAIPKFETGGVVGGSSFYGDKILARVNSRELILNEKQQRGLYNQLNTDSIGTNITLGAGWEISGDVLRLVLDRNDKKNNRLG